MTNTFNFSGDQNNVQIGDNNTQNIDQSGAAELTEEKFVEAVVTAIPEEEVSIVEKENIKTEMVSLMGAYKEEQKTAKPDVENKPSEPLAARTKTFLSKIQPWAPYIGKAVLAFGEASLKSLVSGNPLIAGVVAMCGELRRPGYPSYPSYYPTNDNRTSGDTRPLGPPNSSIGG